MQTTYNISFYCRPSKQDRNGQSPVELSINLNGQRKFINCPLKCSPTEFNRKRKPKYLQDYIDNQRVRVATILVEMATNGVPITADALREYIRVGGVKPYTIGDLFNDYFKLLRARVGVNLSMSVYEKYDIVKRSFAGFMGQDKDIKTLTPANIQEYYIQLQTRYKDSTSGGMMTKLKTVFRYAMDNNKLTTNLFQNIRINKGRTEITTITTAQLNTIITHSFVPRVQRVADLFVFAAGSGLSYIDCCNLTPEDFETRDGKLCIFKRRQKTGVKFYSVLLPWAQTIAEKYNYDLSSLHISNQKINAYLKEIGDICGIQLNMHFHLARHYYAMYLLNKNVPITTVSKAMGHSNLQMTTHYAKALETTIIDEISAIF